MPSFAVALTQRELIQDPAVIDELDRLYARLNGFLSWLGAAVTDESGRGGGGGLTDGAKITGPFVLPVTTLALASDTTNLNPTTFTVLRMIPTGAARTVQGIQGGVDGRQLYLYVPASADQALTLAHESVLADADKRLSLVGATDLTSVAGQARGWILLYDGTAKRWTQMGGSSVLAQAGGMRAVVEGHTQVATGADTNETDLVTATLPANALAADGDTLIIRAYGNFANTSQGKRLRFYWNGTAVADTAAQAWQDKGWQLTVVVSRTGVAAQKGHAQFIPAIAGTSPQPGDFFSDTANLASTVAIKITGANSTAQAGDITFEGWTAFVMGAPA